MNDLIRELGPLALSARLRRLSERLHRDTSRLYRESDLDMEARWFPIIHILADGRSASVTEIATRVGMTHPAVHQIVNAMALANLLRSETDGQDQRRRLLTLTDKGREVVHGLQPLWDRIRAQTDLLLADSGSDLMGALEAMERQLDERNFYQRVTSGQLVQDNAKPRAQSGFA